MQCQQAPGVRLAEAPRNQTDTRRGAESDRTITALGHKFLYRIPRIRRE